MISRFVNILIVQSCTQPEQRERKPKKNQDRQAGQQAGPRQQEERPARQTPGRSGAGGSGRRGADQAKGWAKGGGGRAKPQRNRNRTDNTRKQNTGTTRDSTNRRQTRTRPKGRRTKGEDDRGEEGDRPVQESFGPRWSQNGASHAKCNASTDSTLNHRVWNPSQLSVTRINCGAKAARRRPLTSPTEAACGSASTKPRPRLGGFT